MEAVPIFILGFLFICGASAQTEEELRKSKGGYSEEQIAKYRVTKEECIVDSGVDRVLVDNAEKGQVQIDEKLACFGACMMKKFGVMREDGSIDDEVAIANIPPAVDRKRAIEVFHKCKKAPAKNHCVKAGLMGRCILAHKNYVLTGKM